MSCPYFGKPDTHIDVDCSYTHTGKTHMVAITQWKYGKRWVYSTTYDEVVTSTVENGLPIHEQFGAPGHITVVVGQMGEPRDVQGSGYDATYRHISVAECKLAQRYGW